MLALYGIIQNDSVARKNFINLFSKGVETPIIWYKSNGLLHYFIDRLADEEIIKKPGKLIDWSIVRNSFYEKKAGERYDLRSLNGAKTGSLKESYKKEIDNIIEFLKK
jgi:hypothetical protein